MRREPIAIEQLLHELQAFRTEMLAQLQAIERRLPLRTSAKDLTELLRTISSHAGDSMWTARELVEHAQPALRDELRRVLGVEHTARKLGKLMRQCERAGAAWCLGEDRSGLLWRIADVATIDTLTSALERGAR